MAKTNATNTTNRNNNARKKEIAALKARTDAQFKWVLAVLRDIFGDNGKKLPKWPR